MKQGKAVVPVETLVTTQESVHVDLANGQDALTALVQLFGRLDAGWRVTGIDVAFERQEAVFHGPPRPVRLRYPKRRGR